MLATVGAIIVRARMPAMNTFDLLCIEKTLPFFLVYKRSQYEPRLYSDELRIQPITPHRKTRRNIPLFQSAAPVQHPDLTASHSRVLLCALYKLYYISGAYTLDFHTLPVDIIIIQDWFLVKTFLKLCRNCINHRLFFVQNAQNDFIHNFSRMLQIWAKFHNKRT